MRENLAAIRLVVAMIAIGCTVVARAESPGNSEAEASRREAKVYTDWPFGTVEALRRQVESAAALGVPVEVTDSIGIKLRLIPAGEFMMGSPDNEPERRDDEGPAHRVRITKPFYLGVHEVTQEQYVQLTGSNPSKFAGKTNPVDTVNWKEATEFCAKLSAKDGVEYRLPTEAQWEWACRAGTATPFSFGSATDGSQANNNGKSFYDAISRPPYLEWKVGPSQGRTTVVGSYPPNAWGLHDMHGNVSEWCADWFRKRYYKISPIDDPQGPTMGYGRARRGGNWRMGGVWARAASRLDGYATAPEVRASSLGFRVVCVGAWANQDESPADAQVVRADRPLAEVPDRPPVAQPASIETPPGKSRADEVKPPGVIITASADPKHVHFSSPSIAVLPDGRYVASYDFFQGGTERTRTCVFGSDNAGETWGLLAHIFEQRQSTLFVHKGAPYIIGSNGVPGALVIRRSDDGGRTWTVPDSSRTGLLLPEKAYA